MKIATYNVNSIGARLPVLLHWLASSKPDVACLQELKATDEKFPVDAFLQQFGYETVPVGNGRDAVFTVGREAFDLALMDIEMPVMDGFRAVALIRAGEGPGYRLPIIAMSGHTTEEFRERVLAAGFDGFLPKPIDFEAFGESISARLGWKLQWAGSNG